MVQNLTPLFLILLVEEIKMIKYLQIRTLNSHAKNILPSIPPLLPKIKYEFMSISIV